MGAAGSLLSAGNIASAPGASSGCHVLSEHAKMQSTAAAEVKGQLRRSLHRSLLLSLTGCGSGLVT